MRLGLFPPTCCLLRSTHCDHPTLLPLRTPQLHSAHNCICTLPTTASAAPLPNCIFTLPLHLQPPFLPLETISSPVKPTAEMGSPIHPAITVSNIRNYIPITLEAENSQYTSWVELFKIHCRAFNVLHHIIPTAAPSSKSDDATAADTQWSRLDAIVLQWIYSTISKDLLITILAPNATVASAWTALEHIFVDSKPTRAIHLKQRFSNLKLANFPNMNAYCQEAKNVADQLANVDAPVDNDPLFYNSLPVFRINMMA